MHFLNNCVVYLIGFRGTGKYTVAKELQKITKARLVDNHTINNPIFMLHDVSKGIEDEVWEDVSKIRNIVFEHIKYHADLSNSFIFTNELFDNDEDDIDIYKTVLSLAKHRKATFFPVILHCDLEELLDRAQNKEREKLFKDTSVENIKNLYKAHQILIPDYTNTIELNITALSPNESATAIIEKIAELM